MIPYILAAFGGYLIGDSLKDKQFARGGQTATWGGVRGRLNQPILSFSKVDYDVNVNPNNLEVDVNINERDTAYNALRNVDVEWTQYHWGYMIYPRDVDELYDVLKALRTKVSKERLKRYITEGKQYADGGMMADSNDIEKRILFVNNYYRDEVLDAKKRGNYSGFTKERINKNYQKDLKAAQKGKEFDNFLFEAGYQSKMNGKSVMSDGGWITAKEVSEDWDFYSDMYKADNGFRPRSLSDEQLADWLNSNYKIVIKDSNGEKRKFIEKKINKEKSLLHFVLNEASSGSIANKTKYSSYKDIDAVRNKAVQILMRDGDREYSLASFTDLIQEAVLEYDSEKIN